MKIYIQNKKVIQKFLIHSFYRPKRVEFEIKTMKKYQEKEIGSLKEAVFKGNWTNVKFHKIFSFILVKLILAKSAKNEAQKQVQWVFERYISLISDII